MTKTKWLEMLERVEAKFGIDKEYKESLGEAVPGERQIIEFCGPLGRIKLVWTEKAKLQEVKTLYSNRAGSQIKINKVYKIVINYRLLTLKTFN